uniref:glycosyltransferase family 39 protein n=1 Tax=Methanobrevibacter sp. TaxID=66852 RepID=UPI003890DB56
LSMFLEEFSLDKKDKYILILITLFSVILTGYYIKFNQNLGIYCSDVYVYLLNAVYYTGHNIQSTNNIYLSPVICFLTSILMTIGIKDATSILIITGLFAIIGNIGLYFLLRIKFDSVLSLTGVILYATFALNLTWLANGTIDIPGVSITIWTVIFLILAVDKNPKYYLFAFPAFAIAFFTRYQIIFILPVLILYYLYKKGFKIEKQDLKYIIIGALIAGLLSAIILIPVINMGHGSFEPTSQISSGIGGNHGRTVDPAYTTDVGYYLTNFLNFISSSKVTYDHMTPHLENPTVLSFLIVGILTIGSIIFILKRDYELNKEKLIPLALFIIAILTFNRTSSVVTISITFLGLFLIGRNSKNQMGLMMLSWILVNLIFYSYYSLKVNRYIISAIPPLIYLILASIELINEKVKINKNIIPIVLIILFLVQGFTFCFTFEQTNDFTAPQEISEYIIHENPDYQKCKIGVYNVRPYLWYLGENVTGIPANNPEKIDESNVSYYISHVKIDGLNNYNEIKNIDRIYLYEKISV